MKGDTDVDLTPEEVAPVLSPESTRGQRNGPAAKWNSMTIEQRKDALLAMVERRMLLIDPAVVCAEIVARAEGDTSFSALHYDTQEKVISYLRKNYGDTA